MENDKQKYDEGHSYSNIVPGYGPELIDLELRKHSSNSCRKEWALVHP